jgi:hypothetical protein
MEDTREYRFFTEEVLFDESIPEEKEEAKKYLESWQKFLTRRLHFRLEHYELMEEDIYHVELPSKLVVRKRTESEPVYENFGMMSKKLVFRNKNLPYEIE